MPRQNPLADAVEAALLKSGGPFAFVTNPDGSIVSSSWNRASVLDPGVALGVDRSVDRVAGRHGDRFVEQFRRLPAAPAAPAPAAPPRGIRRARGTPMSPVAADDLQSKIGAALRAANAPAPDPRAAEAEALQLAGIRSALAPRLRGPVPGPMKPRQRPEPIPALLKGELASRTRNPRKVALPPPRPAGYETPERLAKIRQETMPVGPVSTVLQGLMSIFGIGEPNGVLGLGWETPEGISRLRDLADEAARRGGGLGRLEERRYREQIAALLAGR